MLKIVLQMWATGVQIKEETSFIGSEQVEKVEKVKVEKVKVEKDVLSLRGGDAQTTPLLQAIGELKRSIKLQENRLVDLEDRSRRNNFVIFGLNEPSGETAESLKNHVLTEIFQSKLGVTVHIHTVDRMHRLGGKRGSKILFFA